MIQNSSFDFLADLVWSVLVVGLTGFDRWWCDGGG